MRVKPELSVKAHCSFEIRDWDVDGYGVWLHKVFAFVTRGARKRQRPQPICRYPVRIVLSNLFGTGSLAFVN